MANVISKIILELLGKDGTGPATKSAGQNIDKLQGKAKQVKAEFASMTQHFAEALGGLSLAVPLYKGVQAATAMRVELNATTAQLVTSAKSAGELAAWMESLERSAYKIGDATGFTKTEILGLQKELIKAGAGIQDVISDKGAAAAAASLAKLEGMDAEMAGKVLVSIGTPFKVQADEYMTLSDTILRASDASSTGVAEIAEAAKYAAGPMAALGRSTEDTMAMIATLSQSGIEGSMAGTSLNAFFKQAARIKEFQDKHGNLKDTDDILAILRKRTKGMGDAQQANFLNKLFKDEGARAAIALLRSGKNSYEDIKTGMKGALSQQEKLNLAMDDFGSQLERVKKDGSGLFATLFKPAERMTAPVAKGAGDAMSWLGQKAEENPWMGKAATGLAGLLAAGGLVYGGYKLKKGVGAGGRMLDALKGLGSEAAGLAKGKAVEAATGVTPVYITNWPAQMGASGGSNSPVADVIDTVTGGGKKGRLAGWGARLMAGLSGARVWGGIMGSSTLPQLARMGAAGLGTAAGGVAGAGLAGWGIGSMIYSGIDETRFADRLGATIARLMSPLSAEAREALARERAGSGDIGGLLRIQIDADGRPRIAGMQVNTPGLLEMQAYHGPLASGY